MIKSEFIKTITSKMMHTPEHTIAESVNHILESMCHALVNGRRIEIRGFGSFSVHLAQPRQAHNPKTGEKLVTSPTYTSHFKPGKELRERVNASKAHCEIRD